MRGKVGLTVFAAGALALGSAMAQSSVSLRADIPFEFIAGKATMPAGEYAVRSLTQPGIVAINAVDRSANALLLTQGAQALTAPEQAKLVFRKYGDRYFLAEMWGAGGLSGHRLPVTKTERELTQRAANFEVVAVLAKR